MSAKSRISDAVVRRLPRYYRYLRDLEQAGTERISSRELGELMHLTPSQIRQDLNSFGGFGKQGYGYHVPELRRHIGEILGLGRTYEVLIVGAGNIGRAVANYVDFEREGFMFRAIFDDSPAVIGSDIRGITVMPINTLASWIKAHPIDIAVIAVPSKSAQEIADILTSSGIRSIWNFAPVDLRLPENVVRNDVHLSDSLHILTYRMNEALLFAAIDRGELF